MTAAQPATTRPFRYFLRVRFSECDPQRVVFNGCYGLYIDLAVLEFMRSAGFGQQVVKGNFDYQVVRQTLEWKRPARFDDVVEVAVRASHLGNTSFTIVTEFRVKGDDALAATGETVCVLVDARSLEKMRLPDDFRAALAHGAAGLSVDHADSTPNRDE